MKVLAILPTYRPGNEQGGIGGGEISNRILLEGLASLGHDVRVVAIKGANASEKLVNGVVVYEVSEKLFCGSSDFLARYYSLEQLVSRVALKFDPDVVLTATEAAAIALKASRRLKKPLGVFIRAYENFPTEKIFSQDRFKEVIKKIMAGDYGRRSLEGADFLIPNSDFMSCYCRDKVRVRKELVVYPPLDVNLDIEIVIPHDIKKISMVGTAEKKGVSIFKAVAESFPKIDFRVLGCPGLHPGEECSVRNVTFVGWCDAFEDFKSNSDLVLVPSLWAEPFGRVAIEALAAGKAVLVSDIGGLTETVSGQERLLVEPGCVWSWKNRIEELISNPEPFSVASNKARMSAKKYSKKRQVECLESFLESMLPEVIRCDF